MNRYRALFVAFIVVIAAIPAGAANYYLSPSGDDARTGLSPALAWATLQHAEEIMAAGDTLFIMGGTYPTPQRFHRYGGVAGAPGRPMVFKAYGDARAIFQYTGGGDRQNNRYWYFEGGADWVTIDGFGYRAPHEPLMIKLEGREDASYVVRFVASSTNTSVACNVKGIEIDGNFPTPEMIAAGTPGGLMRYAIGWIWGDRDTLLANYIHDVYHPTGDIYPGDGTDRSQGTGEALFLESCSRMYIARNTFGNANHAAMSVQPNGTDAPPSFAIKVVDNYVDNRWGGGLYYAACTEYSLLERNIIVHSGETTTKTKGPLYLAGPHNTARLNVTYSPWTDGIGVKAAGFGGYCFIPDSNMVYNNTFFASRFNVIQLLVNNTGAYSCATAHMWGTTVANNIMYKSHERTQDIGADTNPYYSDFKLYFFDAANEYNWVDPDQPGVLPSSTHFGGSRIYNNCVLRDGLPAGYERIVGYASSVAEGRGTYGWSIAQVEAMDPVAWRGNIERNPTLASENPDAMGVFSDWWHLTAGSPCIDAGAIINDYNGAYVERYYASRGEPGYGWTALTFRGSAPDIGAHEYSSEDPAPFLGPHQNRVQPR